jgi:hypothetical protein
MNRCAAVEMEELMLSPSHNPDDSPLPQSSRGRVGKLSRDGGMKRLCSRDRLAFDRFAETLYCFFDLGELGHIPLGSNEKETCVMHSLF